MARTRNVNISRTNVPFYEPNYDVMSNLGDSLGNLADMLGPKGQAERALDEVRLGAANRLKGGGASPVDYDMATGRGTFSTAAGVAGIDPFQAMRMGGGMDMSKILAGGNQTEDPAAGLEMAGWTPEQVQDIVGTPSPRAQEENAIGMETLRDRVSALNNVHMQINSLLQMQGRKERLPIYDPTKMNFQLPYSNVRRAQSQRKLSQNLNDLVQGAQQALHGMQTSFGVGPEEAATVVPPQMLQYLRNFADNDDDLFQMVTDPEGFRQRRGKNAVTPKGGERGKPKTAPGNIAPGTPGYGGMQR